MESITAWEPEQFMVFWRKYPKKGLKFHAIKEWDRLMPSENEIAEIMRQLDIDKKSDSWQNNIGIPYANAWLHRRPWIQ